MAASLGHLADRVRELVFLDAFVPADGQTVRGLSGRDRPRSTFLGAEWLVPPPDRQYDDAEEGAWQTARRVAHPVRCFTEPARLANPIATRWQHYEIATNHMVASNRPTELVALLTAISDRSAS